MSLRPNPQSKAELLAALPEDQRQEILSELSRDEMLAMQYDWQFWARPEQLPPAGDDWNTWLVLAGRGFGKTRTGAETVRGWVESGVYSRIALIAPTAADARDVMVEGESGIMAVCPPWNRPTYEPSKRRVTWRNGALATLYSADEPDRLRGPQHDAAWCDELAAWNYIDEAWTMMNMGLRLGARPRCIVTTTPKPLKIIRELVKDPHCHVIRGATHANRPNLPAEFFSKILKRYEGTRIGRQELLAEILDDVPGALWTRATIEASRTDGWPDELARVVVAIDPAVTATEGSDETGIIIAGQDHDGLGHVLADRSCRAAPIEWARRAVDAFWHWSADCIVAECNNGGDMVRATIASVDDRVPVRLVRATRGKAVRAEPISALYEQGRIKHPRGIDFSVLEDQMCSYSPGVSDKSPDRMDALVWAFWWLYLSEGEVLVIHEDRVTISNY
jgi:phage terminase large subunit-like protein